MIKFLIYFLEIKKFKTYIKWVLGVFHVEWFTFMTSFFVFCNTHFISMFLRKTYHFQIAS